MLIEPKDIDPALHAALLDCASPTVSTDSLITVITALSETRSRDFWLYDFPCSLIAPEYSDTTFLETLCVARWEAIHAHLLSRTGTPAIAALVIHCANLGAPVAPSIIEHYLKILAHHEYAVCLAPPVIAQIPPSYFKEFLASYGRLVFHGWDTHHDLIAAWVLHPSHREHPEILRDHFRRYMPSRDELWNACREATRHPSILAALKVLILSLPDSWHVTLLACHELSDAEITRYLRTIGQAKMSLLIGLPGMTIPSTAWNKLTGPVCLRAIIHLYNAEEPGRLLPDHAIPQDVIDRAKTDLAIRGTETQLLEEFAVADQRHQMLHAHGFDPHTWLSSRLDDCFAHDRSHTARLGFLCRLVHWIDEDPVGRQAIAEDFLAFYATWDAHSRETLDTTPQSRLTIALFRLQPSFLFPVDHIDNTADRFTDHPTYPLLPSRP